MIRTFDPDLDAALDRVGRNADAIEYAEAIMRNRAWFRDHPPKSVDAAVWEWAFVRRISVDFSRTVDTNELRYVLRNRDYPARFESFSFGFMDFACLGKGEAVAKFSDALQAAERRLHPLALPKAS